MPSGRGGSGSAASFSLACRQPRTRPARRCTNSRGGLAPEFRRPPVLPDAGDQRRRSDARDPAGRRGRGGHRPGEARAALPRSHPPRQAGVRLPARRVPGERGVRDDQGGGGARHARGGARDVGNAARHPSGRRRHHSQLLRPDGGGIAVGAQHAAPLRHDRGSSSTLHSAAATPAPITGPIQYTAWASHCHATSAGPIARAGFIAAPVKLPPTSASTKIARPMPKPAILGASDETAVPQTPLTRKKASAAPTQTPCMKPTSFARRGVPPSATLTGILGSTPLRSAAPAIAPSSWATMYLPASRPSILFAIHSPTVTAGLIWPPEMLMVIDTMIAIPTPCARATPSGPMLFAPRVDPALTSATTLPAPRNTKSSVPTNSID